MWPYSEILIIKTSISNELNIIFRISTQIAYLILKKIWTNYNLMEAAGSVKEKTLGKGAERNSKKLSF